MGIPNMSVRWRLEAKPAPGLIRIGFTDEQAVRILNETLGPVCRRAATNTDRQGFRDVFGDGKQLRHRIEGFSPEVLIQPSNNDTLSGIRQLVANTDQIHVEELPFVDADHLRPAVEKIQDFEWCLYQLRFHFHVTVADDVIFAKPVIEPGLENLDSLASDLSTA